MMGPRVDNRVSKTFPYYPPVTKTPKKRTVACITGAHRSGTSMVARLLHSCGLDLGPESDLMPPAPDNPDGFWENLSFVAMNDELLNELGGAWDLPPRATRFAEKRFDAVRARARLLVSAFSRSKVWGWKDPRNSLTLPFWRTIVPRLRTVIIVRNPLEVAYSLHQRNGVSFHLALSLWGVYSQHALSATTPKNRIVSHYDSFFHDPEAELRRILSFVDLPDSKAAKAAALISRERRHTHFATQQLLDAHIPHQLFQLYQQLSAEAGRVTDAELAASRLPAVAEEDQRQSRKRRVSGEALAAASARLPESPGVNLALLEADSLRREVALLTSELKRQAERIEQMSELKRQAERIEQMSAAVFRSEEELKQRDAIIAANNAEIERITSALSSVQNELKERERSISDIQAQLTESQQERERSISDIQAQLTESQ